MDRICYGLYILQLLLNLLKFRLKSFCCSRFVFFTKYTCMYAYICVLVADNGPILFLTVPGFHTYFPMFVNTFVHFLQFFFFFTQIRSVTVTEMSMLTLTGFFFKIQTRKSMMSNIKDMNVRSCKKCIYIYIYKAYYVHIGLCRTRTCTRFARWKSAFLKPSQYKARLIKGRCYVIWKIAILSIC